MYLCKPCRAFYFPTEIVWNGEEDNFLGGRQAGRMRELQHGWLEVDRN